MLENFSSDEIKKIVAELNEKGYVVKVNRKGELLEQESEALGMKDPFITKEVKDAIFALADWAADNYTKTPSKSGGAVRKLKNKGVGSDIEEEYRRVLRGILKTIKPHFNKKVGFRDRSVPWKGIEEKGESKAV